MNPDTELLLIHGTDKSESIASYSFDEGKCTVVFHNSDKQYTYNSASVKLYPLRKAIDPETVVVTSEGSTLTNVRQILDFGEYCKINTGRNVKLYPKDEISVRENCLIRMSSRQLFDYFKQIAEAVSLVSDDGFNILAHQYAKIGAVSDETVLASYLAQNPAVKKRQMPETLIYPFGLNQSQKQAVENAFSSQISIIQGPPGTGKTQTILNIIANAVSQGKTVAVVSNNNSATHNVAEKLAKKKLDFITAFLGSRANKDTFLKTQTGGYPDMQKWKLKGEELSSLSEQVRNLTAEINERLNDKNRIAEINQELLALDPESQYFAEYYETCPKVDNPRDLRMSAQKTLELCNEYESVQTSGRKVGFFTKLRIMLRYNHQALKLFLQDPDAVMPYLQRQFYILKSGDLHKEKERLQQNLKDYAFDQKAQQLTDLSLKLFRHWICCRYHDGGRRQVFDSTAFYRNCEAFNKEYPVILSTTYSVKSCLSTEHIYDYLIVDESSQVDLATGVLALSCARNVVIVGDLKQLPNVLTEQDIHTADAFWKPGMQSCYQFTKHSLLSSAVAVWKDAPSVLLREHYRCHPKIINFCNQKFYDGQLIIMTKDVGEEDALSLYHTNAGNHARGHSNQREVDVIRNEILPKLSEAGYQDIGVITPYRAQVRALREQIPDTIEVDTVHKFQGREKDAIILTSVDNIITDFVDDYHMLNVAVSRAVKSLTVVTSHNPKNDHTNYGDLTRYIAYHNFEVVESNTYSVFDLLYKEYAQQRKNFLSKRKRISEYDSENLMYAVLEDVLQQPEFRQIGCACHVSLATLVKNFSLLTEEETCYARNPLTHTDFLLFNKMDKAPILAIEVDGTSFHKEGSKQADRDIKKNHIMAVCGLPLLRLRTDSSEEKKQIESALRDVLTSTMRPLEYQK